MRARTCSLMETRKGTQPGTPTLKVRIHIRRIFFFFFFSWGSFFFGAVRLCISSRVPDGRAGPWNVVIVYIKSSTNLVYTTSFFFPLKLLLVRWLSIVYKDLKCLYMYTGRKKKKSLPFISFALFRSSSLKWLLGGTFFYFLASSFVSKEEDLLLG